MIIIYIIFFIVIFKLYQKISAGKCKSKAKLNGKVVIVTGSSNGIGYETAKDLAARGARVILACRNEAKATKAKQAIIKETGNEDVSFKHLDLSSLQSVRDFVEDFKRSEDRLDVLVNNAGVAGEGGHTEDGILRDMQVNYFGHFLLTVLLLPMLKRGAPSRIVNVSSNVHILGVVNFKYLNTEGHYNYARRYCNNKLLQVLFTIELDRRLRGSGVTVNCAHPGVVYTNIINETGRFVFPIVSFIYYWFFKTPSEGAQTSIHVAVSGECDNVSGKYFMDCREHWMTWKARDPELTLKLWEYSVQLVKLNPLEICV